MTSQTAWHIFWWYHPQPSYLHICHLHTKRHFTASTLNFSQRPLFICSMQASSWHQTPQASHFNTDVVNRAGFSKLFMGHSDKMWARGKARIPFSFSLSVRRCCDVPLCGNEYPMRQQKICRTWWSMCWRGEARWGEASRWKHNSQSSDIPGLGNVKAQTLASFYKDDNYRSPLLERGIKLLEMLITGRFLNLSKWPFHPISNEMKALGTSLDLMKVILKILIRTRLHNKTHCFLFTTASKSKR